MAATESKDCPVCYGPVHFPVVCPGVTCGYKVCQQCFRHFALDSVTPAHCMQCKRPLLREELVELTNRTFVAKTYTDHRKAMLLSMEKSLLPEAQRVLEDLWGPDISGSTEELQEQLKAQEAKCTDVEQQMAELTAQRDLEYRKSSDLRWAIERRLQSHDVKFLQTRATWRSGEKKRVPEEERRQFVWKCPASDCRGFLSQKWKCALCGVFVCDKCGEVKKGMKDEEHTCKKELAESMKYLRETSRNCPSCAAPIFKIAGCDQMWCTLCHTAFSWDTGKVLDNSHIHNPHYVQWLQENPGTNVRDAGDVQCGGIPYLDDHKARKLLSEEQLRYALNFQARLNHHQDVTVPKLSLPMDAKRQLLRLRYLNKELSEEEWMRDLMKITKRVEFAQCALQVYNMLANAGADLVRNCNGQCTNTNRKKAKEDVLKTLAEMVSLVAYVDDQLQKLAKAYGYTPGAYTVFPPDHRAKAATGEAAEEAASDGEA